MTLNARRKLIKQKKAFLLLLSSLNQDVIHNHNSICFVMTELVIEDLVMSVINA